MNRLGSLVERVLCDEGPGLLVSPSDEVFELDRLHPPLAPTADLDRRKFAASHQGIDLGGRGVEHLSHIAKSQETASGVHSVTVPFLSGMARRARRRCGLATGERR